MKIKSCNRRSFFGFVLKAGLPAAALGGLSTALTPEAEAALGSANILTDMAISLQAKSPITPTTVITVTARLRRLDGSTASLAGVPVAFRIGGLTYATSPMTTYYTNAQGVITFTFRCSGFGLIRGKTYVVVADVNPASGGERLIAYPRPYATFRLS